MSHDTHGHQHDTHNDNPSVQFNSAFYFVIILAGLFLAAMAFIKSMSHTEEGHGAAHAQHTEAPAHEGHASEATHEATTTDSTHHEEEHKEETAAAEHH